MSQVPDGTPGRGRKKRWKKIALIAAGIVAAIPVLIVLLAFSGVIRMDQSTMRCAKLRHLHRTCGRGIDHWKISVSDMIINMIPMPSPAGSSVTAKRNAVKRGMEAAFNALEPTTQLTYFATSSYDECYRGRNNWMIHDGYAHRCDLRITRYYGFNRDFRLTMLDLDQKLASQNWQTIDGGSPSRVILGYYDAFYGQPEIDKNFGGRYLVSDLPQATAQKDSTMMEISYLERASKDKADGKGLRKLTVAQYDCGLSECVAYPTAYPTTVYEDKKFVNVNSLFDEITESNRYVLIIVLQKTYFEN